MRVGYPATCPARPPTGAHSALMAPRARSGGSGVVLRGIALVRWLYPRGYHGRKPVELHATSSSSSTLVVLYT